MPIQLRVDKKHRLIRAELYGTFETADIFDNLAAALDDPDFEPGFNVLSDHTQIEQIVTTAQVKDISDYLRRMSTQMAGAKWAVVTSEPASYGMMRMLSVYLEQVPIELRIFDSTAAALAWLNTPSFPDLRLA